MLDTKFQYFSANIKKPNAIDYITLKNFLRATKYPKKNVKEILKDIGKGNKSRKIELFSFTPCVNLRKRRAYKDIIKFTGLLVLDFDHIENAKDLKEHIFNEFSCVIASWISPSLKGVKALAKIPIVNTIDEFKAYYWGIADKMMEFDGFDTTGQNAVLPLFISYDKDILIRNNPTTWTKKGNNPKAFKPVEQRVSTAPKFEPTELHNRRVIGIIKSQMSKATNNGHPTVRSSSLNIGGYVASGYINFHEALSLMYFLIETNSYLQKGISGYKKTAMFFINEGMKAPLNLN